MLLLLLVLEPGAVTMLVLVLTELVLVLVRVVAGLAGPLGADPAGPASR